MLTLPVAVIPPATGHAVAAAPAEVEADGCDFFLKRIFLFHEYLIVLRTDSKNRLHPQRDSAKTLHIAQKS